MPHNKATTSTEDHYTKMADYYDTIYKSFVDYPAQTRHLEKIVARHRKKRPRSVLDIACGTGNYTFIFANKGYRTDGIDSSDSMLKIAREKGAGKANPRFYKMDMRRIRLDSKYDLATVLFGGFGYLVTEEDVGEFLGGVANHLNPGGLIMFEFWHNSAIRPAASRPGGERSWERIQDRNRLILRLNMSRYDAQTNIHNTTFDIYSLDLKTRKLLESFSESHRIRTYTITQMRDLLTKNQFKPLGFYDSDLVEAEKDKPSLASFSTFRVMAVAEPNA